MGELQFQPHEVSYSWAANASLVMLTSANNFANAMAINMSLMVQAYLQDVNENINLVNNQQVTTTEIMQGTYSGPFDDYNSKNAHQIWDPDGGSPSDNSDKINEDEAIVSNSNATFKLLEGSFQSSASSGSSWLSSTQQNQKQLFTFMNNANGMQDYLSSLLASPLI